MKGNLPQQAWRPGDKIFPRFRLASVLYRECSSFGNHGISRCITMAIWAKLFIIPTKRICDV